MNVKAFLYKKKWPSEPNEDYSVSRGLRGLIKTKGSGSQIRKITSIFLYENVPGHHLRMKVLRYLFKF